jgi:hypothetical protein
MGKIHSIGGTNAIHACIFDLLAGFSMVGLYMKYVRESQSELRSLVSGDSSYYAEYPA